jgi:hypothetical protein
MSKREPSVLLDDIRTSIEKIQRYTAGLDEGSFLADEKTTDAVVHNLEIIGEAAKQLPAEFKNRHSAIPKALVLRHFEHPCHPWCLPLYRKFVSTCSRRVSEFMVGRTKRNSFRIISNSNDANDSVM